MTPAVIALREAGVAFDVHTYPTRADGDFAAEAAAALNVRSAQVFKTLIAQDHANALIVALVPATHSLDLKALAGVAGAKKLVMASQTAAERATGYLKGGISPFAQKKKLPTFADSSILEHDTVYVSGGRRGVELALSPGDLLEVCGARTANLCTE